MRYARIDIEKLKQLQKDDAYKRDGEMFELIEIILSCLEPSDEQPTKDDETCEIVVSPHHIALVDKHDFDRLRGIKWHIRTSGNGKIKYATRRTNDGRTEGMHRIIMGLHIDDERMVDHINDNGLDNRRENLRICTKAENTRNLRSYGKTSDYKGVSWHTKREKWQATIAKSGEQKWLGYFDDEKEAAREYDAMAKEWFGEFARLNFAKPETKECEHGDCLFQFCDKKHGPKPSRLEEAKKNHEEWNHSKDDCVMCQAFSLIDKYKEALREIGETHGMGDCDCCNSNELAHKALSDEQNNPTE